MHCIDTPLALLCLCCHRLTLTMSTVSRLMMMSLTTLYLEQVDDDEPEDGGAAGEEGEGFPLHPGPARPTNPGQDTKTIIIVVSNLFVGDRIHSYH